MVVLCKRSTFSFRSKERVAVQVSCSGLDMDFLRQMTKLYERCHAMYSIGAQFSSRHNRPCALLNGQFVPESEPIGVLVKHALGSNDL